MEVFLALLSLLGPAVASLEPAGYRLASAPTSSQYLPPRDREQHQQGTGAATSSQYLLPPPPPPPPTPLLSSESPSKPSSSAYFYLPPQRRLPEPSFLPATAPAAVSNDYLPPPAPRASSSSVGPFAEYLPPRSRPAATAASIGPTAEYLGPSRAPSPPGAGYLPGGSASKPPPPPAAGPATDYQRTPGPASTQPGYPAPALPSSRPSPAFKSAAGREGQAAAPLAPAATFQPESPGYGPARARPTGASSTSSSLLPIAAIGPTAGPPPSTKGLLPRPGGNGLEPPPDNYLPAREPEQDGAAYSSESDSGSYEDQLTEEPLKYDFEYRVSDEFGNDYGHRESRAGSQTQGSYSVLLPDGRRQIVHYQADESGFKPRISYEEAATVLGPKAPELAGYDAPGNSLEAHGPY